MVTCPQCSFEFYPKELYPEEFGMVSLQCPSCKCIFAKRIMIQKSKQRDLKL